MRLFDIHSICTVIFSRREYMLNNESLLSSRIMKYDKICRRGQDYRDFITNCTYRKIHCMLFVLVMHVTRRYAEIPRKTYGLRRLAKLWQSEISGFRSAPCTMYKVRAYTGA